jgi:hypothetical protein
VIADYLEGKWSPDLCSIGDAVQACCGSHLGVSVMEAIRVRTFPLTVNGWQHMAGRTEADVLRMLRHVPAPEAA